VLRRATQGNDAFCIIFPDLYPSPCISHRCAGERRGNLMNQTQMLLMGAVLTSVSIPLYAANESLDPIVVTATRMAQTTDETLAAVTVISRDQIEASQSQSVMDLLQNHSVGIDISRTGGPGSSTSIFLRGSNSDHVLVLVDGVRVSSVTSGSFNWSALSPDQIERIEVVRGPNSTLYGSEAIGGVVQIFTRKDGGLYGTLRAGSYGTGKAVFGNSGSLGEGRYHFNLEHEYVAGFSSKNSDSFNYEPDKDSYRNNSITAGFELPVNDNVELGLNLFNTKSKLEYDDKQANSYANTRNSGANLTLDWQTSGSWQQHFSVNASRDQYTSYDSRPTDITTQRSGFNWQNDFQIGDAMLLTAGYDYQQDKGENNTNYDKKLDNSAGYLQFQWSDDVYDLLFGARVDDSSTYGSNSTGRITLGRALDGARIYASIANAYKAPTFNQLYYPGYGDTDIKAEKSTSTELGYRRGGLQASLYHTEVRNLIKYDSDAGGAVNVGKATINGLELSYAHSLLDWQVDSGLTLMSTEDEKTGDRLLRRADKKLFVNFHGPLNDRMDMGVETSYTGPSMDSKSVELVSYTLINLTTSYRLDRHWKLSARADNVLDEDYQLANGYNTAGASAFVSVSYQQ
jgi:vitamin B12 transporter